MTHEELIREVGKVIPNGVYSEEVIQLAFTMFSHGYNYAVDKACEWLEKYAANFVALPDEGQQPIGDTNAIYGTKSLLYYLRKGMED